MLQIKNLNIEHRRDLRVILENFNLVLNTGDKAVIIGEEGNGKSTLLKWIFDPALVAAYAECGGERILGAERLAYLPQELPDERKGLSVYEFFSATDAFFDCSPKELSELAARFRLSPEFFYGVQRMDTLSGGEKVKAQLLRIFLERPTVLLLDEPSNDLDLATLELLESLINEWEGIVLFTSHDETLIERTATVVIHLEQLKRKSESRYAVVRDSYLRYRQQRAELFVRKTQQAENERKEKRLRDEKYARLYNSVERALSSVSRQAPGEGKNLKDKMHVVKAMGKRFEKEDAEMTEMPEQEEAIFFRLGGEAAVMPRGKTVIDYALTELETPDGERLLARDIHLKLRGPERLCIIGENGAGKTSLLRRIAADLLARKDLRAQYMPQNYEDLLDLERTPVDFLDSSGDKAVRTKIRTYLGALKFTAEEMDHPMRELSGGQKAKVLLLKMSLSDANVLILDEPTRNFSPLSGPVIRSLLAAFPGAVISISHDRKYIDEVCTRVLRLTERGLVPAPEFGKQD